MTALARDLERGRRTLTAERLDDGLVVLSFYVAEHRQNVITEEVVRDLADALDGLDAGPEPRGVVLLSARSGSFFAGADINRLKALKNLPAEEIERLCAAGRGLFQRLSDRPWPTVAVIDGACLGGGLELALACDLRIATTQPHTVIGLPEVKLGLLPGWGGTVRLSRLIGPGPAVEFAAGGEPIDGAAALRLGLVDACVPAAQAFESARRLVEHHRERGDHLARRARMAGPCPLVPEEKAFLEATSAAVILGRTGGHYPAPPAILATVLAGMEVDAEEAGRIEGRAFAALARSAVATQLVRVFRIGERNRHDAGIDVPAGDVPAMERPAVVGAGIMGAGIAASHLRAGFGTTLVDVQAEALARSVAGILDEAAWDRTTKRTDSARALALAGNLRTATQLSALDGSDLVIESVVERTDVKRQVLTEIEQMVDPDTVIATNTSTNPITKLATALGDPSRFCGIHFFNPVRRMTLVEVVRGPATSDRTIAIAVAHAKRLGKCPIVVHDSPGFLVNRLLMPYLHESVEMLREGGEAKRIDRVARAFGMPMGPLELYDMIGLDTAFYAGLVLNDAYGDRIEASPVIPALVRSGRLGRKSGAGFYIYSDGASAQRGDPKRVTNPDGASAQRGDPKRVTNPDGASAQRGDPKRVTNPDGANAPQTDAKGGRPRIVRPDEGVADLVTPYALPSRPVTDAVIADRLLLPVVLEATRVLDEGIVRDGRDIDLAVIHALGFPAFRGGVLAWADSLGAAEVCRRLEPLADLGVRMHPTPRLIEMARSGGRFTTED